MCWGSSSIFPCVCCRPAPSCFECSPQTAADTTEWMNLPVAMFPPVSCRYTHGKSLDLCASSVWNEEGLTGSVLDPQGWMPLWRSWPAWWRKCTQRPGKRGPTSASASSTPTREGKFIGWYTATVTHNRCVKHTCGFKRVRLFFFFFPGWKILAARCRVGRARKTPSRCSRSASRSETTWTSL